MDKFDRFLSENSTPPNWVAMHPSVWNGYWAIKKRPRIISKLFRFLGRSLKSRRLYWIGLSLYWEKGWKDLNEWKGIEAELIDINDLFDRGKNED